MKTRKRKIIYRQTLTDEFGKSFKIAVPVTLTDYWFEGKWIPAFDPEESNKIDVAIEKAYPGWFHKVNSKENKCFKNCPACKRKRLAKRQ